MRKILLRSEPSVDQRLTQQSQPGLLSCRIRHTACPRRKPDGRQPSPAPGWGFGSRRRSCTKRNDSHALATPVEERLRHDRLPAISSYYHLICWLRRWRELLRFDFLKALCRLIDNVGEFRCKLQRAVLLQLSFSLLRVKPLRIAVAFRRAHQALDLAQVRMN